MSELERSFTLDGHIIVAKFLSSNDIKKNALNLEYDYIILSQDLLNNESIEESVNALKSMNLIHKCIAVLRDVGVHENFLATNSIQYYYENVAPSLLVQNIVQKYTYEVQYQQTTQNFNQPQYNQQQNGYNNQFANTIPNSPFMPQQPQQQSQSQYNQQPQMNFSNNFQQGMNQMPQPQQNMGMAPNFSGIPNYSGIPNQQSQQTEQTKEKTSKESFFNRNSNFVNYKNTFVVVNSPKGGVGKTTLAIELATTIAERAKGVDLNPASKLDYAKEIKICLLDLNPSFDTMASTLSCVRNVSNYPTILNWVDKIEQKIYATMTNEERMAYDENKEDFDLTPYCNTKTIRFTWQEVQSLTIRDEATGLYIIPAVPLPTDVEKVLPDYISVIIETVKEFFGVTITDTSNNLTYFTVEALLQADEVLLVSVPNIATSTVLKRVLDTCQKQLQIDISKFGLVVNNPNRANSELDGNAIASALDIPLIATIPYDEAVGESLEKGMPYSYNNQKSKYSQAISKLAHQIIPLWNVGKRKATKASSPKKRFFFKK